MKMERWTACTILLILGINSIRDIRKREILLPVTVPGILCGLLLSFLTEGLTPGRIAALGIGGTFLAVSFLSAGQFGTGDGLMLLMLGTVLPAEKLVFVICCSFSLAFISAAGILLYDRSKRKQKIPFVPFLLAGYFCSILLW